jgi:hypothetical protein
LAAGLGLKAGLWEIRVVKQTADGRDISGQMAASMQRMQQAMASLTPEQRARMEAMMKQSGVSAGSNGGFRICVSPEMAQRDTPILDPHGHCQPASVTHQGNETHFQFSCTTNGVTMSGQGVATVQGDTINTHTDVTTRTSGGETHSVQSDSAMSYLGPDCGDLKPPTPPAAHP